MTCICLYIDCNVLVISLENLSAAVSQPCLLEDKELLPVGGADVTELDTCPFFSGSVNNEVERTGRDVFCFTAAWRLRFVMRCNAVTSESDDSSVVVTAEVGCKNVRGGRQWSECCITVGRQGGGGSFNEITCL